MAARHVFYTLAVALGGGLAGGLISARVGPLVFRPPQAAGSATTIDSPEMGATVATVREPSPAPTPKPVPEPPAAMLPAPAAARPAGGPVFDPVVAAAAEKRERETVLHDHGEEPRDRSWASATERVLSGELGQFAQDKHFEVRDVDCRTTTCVASLSWPSYSDAQRVADEIVQKAYGGKKCARSLYLPPPEDPSATNYEGRLVFACEADRADNL